LCSIFSYFTVFDHFLLIGTETVGGAGRSIGKKREGGRSEGEKEMKKEGSEEEEGE
jgi:hypothetical protein